MHCNICGSVVAAVDQACPQCGRPPRSRLIYVPFCAVLGGIVGSLIGFTLFHPVGALLGGLLGILLAEGSARLVLRPRR